MPALGQSWSSLVNERITLKKYSGDINNDDMGGMGILGGPRRIFKISLSSRLKSKKIPFIINSSGLTSDEF